MGADPYQVVRDFECAVAEFAGARYGVATDSCSSAILLSLLHAGARPGVTVSCPNRTYPSVPASILHTGARLKWCKLDWTGTYGLYMYEGMEPLLNVVIDSAKRFRRGMYLPAQGMYWCASFHAKKHLSIGRGGMVLTDDEAAARWLRKARFDGRDEVPLSRQEPSDVLGYNCYLLPELAARGLMLLGAMISRGDDNLPDQVESPDYPDLSLWPAFQQGEVR